MTDPIRFVVPVSQYRLQTARTRTTDSSGMRLDCATCPICGIRLVDGMDFDSYAVLYGEAIAEQAFGIDTKISGIETPGCGSSAIEAPE